MATTRIAVAALVLGAACTPDAPTREPPAGTPPAVDPLPPETVELIHSDYFAFAVPEYCGRRHT